MMKNPKYILTGASGWLGLNFLENVLELKNTHNNFGVLKKNEYIRVFLLSGQSLPKKILEDSRIDIIYGNIKDSISLKKLCVDAKDSILIHAAGIIHPLKSTKEFYEINHLATLNLLSLAKDYGLKKAVVISSNSPLGCNPLREHRFVEDSPYNPYMNYGRSKMLMEIGIKKIFSQEFPIAIIRAPWFYGPHQPSRQILFFKMIKDGKVPIVGDGENYRSMVYIDNLVQGILLAALKSKSNNEIFWIADEVPYTMNEIIDTIEYILEKDFQFKCKKKRVNLPSFVSEIAYFLDKIIQRIGFYHQKIHVLSEMNKNIACDITKAKQILGYSPKFNLYSGMKNSIEELKEGI